MRNIWQAKIWLFLILMLSFAAFAADKKHLGKVESFKFASKLMAREMPYRVILPHKYKQKDEKKLYPVIYMLHGLTGHFDNWTDKTKIAEYASEYKVIIVMPEGNDGWYSDSISVPNDKYESHLIQEFIREIDFKFRTIAKREGRIIAGLSMGGYGSLKFGIKYPDKFVLVGSFSGALDAPKWTDKTLGNGWKVLTDSIMGVYGAEDSQTRKDNDIYKIVREISTEKAKSLPFIYLDCGTEDGLILQNRDFANLLFEKKIPYEFRQLPGKHDWKFWDSQSIEFFEIAARILPAAEEK